VSDAFEDQEQIPLIRDGYPILGMQKFIVQDRELADLFKQKKADWVLSPNGRPDGPLIMRHRRPTAVLMTTKQRLLRHLPACSVKPASLHSRLNFNNRPHL
jgi:hypothetical protein